MMGLAGSPGTARSYRSEPVPRTGLGQLTHVQSGSDQASRSSLNVLAIVAESLPPMYREWRARDLTQVLADKAQQGQALASAIQRLIPLLAPSFVLLLLLLRASA
jgi:hypothetical protein